MANMHISCSVSEPVSSILGVEKLLTRYNHKVTYWNRGNEYDDNMINNCDGVVFILPKFSWYIALFDLPPGMLKEYHTARSLNKDLYVAYRIRDESIYLYSAKTTCGTLSAEGCRVSGSKSDRKETTKVGLGIPKRYIYDFRNRAPYKPKRDRRLLLRLR